MPQIVKNAFFKQCMVSSSYYYVHHYFYECKSERDNKIYFFYENVVKITFLVFNPEIKVD